MSKVVALADRIAPTDASVLITGESGTGKSLLAEYIHSRGTRRRGPFVTVPCANIPGELFESELFGHEPGAHTDAVGRRIGRFEAAAGGTILLDGIQALVPPLQAKLLRVLQERVFERLGGSQTLRVDARFIAAAGTGLEEEVRAGRFRGDLYYRLHVVHLELPPLRERSEDIIPLAGHILKRLAARDGGPARRLTPAGRRVLKAHAWPGNVRELANVLESAVLLYDARAIGPEHLAMPRGTPAEEAVLEAFRRRWSLETLEAVYIREVLKAARGNKSRAAAILGINRKTLLMKLRRSAG
jgi:DNA-binding NtrC family response regulator